MTETGSLPPPSHKGWLMVVGLAYLAFVIYGSLVPLKFSPMPLATAIDKFRAIPYLELGMASRADWVANLLLFIPLAFLWCGVLWPKRNVWLATLSAAIVILVCGGLSIAIEFVQLFFPQRTVSLNDIYAEFLGGCIGVALWCLTGSKATKWLQATSLIRGTTGIAQRLLAAYLFVMLGYNLLPLDLTLSPVELYHKWSEGKVILMPFSAEYASPAQFAYEMCSDIAVWIPVAVLWRWSYRTPTISVWLCIVAAATTLEFLQLFVYSRVTDATDIITAGAGGAIGAWVSARWANASRRQHNETGKGRPSSHMSSWIIAILVWLGVLAVVFWYPFDFNFDRSFLRDRLLTLRQVPFNAYYFGSEFRAITEVLHKTGFMFPLGLLLGGLQTSLRRYLHPGIVNAGLLTCIIATAIGIEAMQLFLPKKNADLTDCALEIAGGVLGYIVLLAVRNRLAGLRSAEN